jgi:hypothetical protein
MDSAARKIQHFMTKRDKNKLKRMDSAARKIQHFMSKRRKQFTPKTRLMTYEKERVQWLIDKKYSTQTDDVAVIETPIPPSGSVDILATDSDAHKLVMIITKYTATGCESKKYVILASDLEIDDELDGMFYEFPKATRFIRDILEKAPKDLIKGRTHDYPRFTITLRNLLRLAKLIIEEFNGKGSSRTTPIDIYDLSCNSFGPFIKKEIDERDRDVIRMIDNYAREKNHAYGGKSKKLH